MHPHDDDTTATPRRNTRRTRSTRWIIGGLIAAGALAGIGTAAALAGGDADETVRAAPPAVESTTVTTISDELDDWVGDQVDGDHVHTHTHDHDHADGSCDCPDTLADDDIDDADDAEQTGEDAQDVDDAEQVDQVDDDEWYGDDPFEGMTDEEIDALSDDEFEQLLEDAGWILDEDGEFDEDGGFDDWEEFAPLGTFEVDGDRIDIDGAEVDADTAALAQRIWDRFVTLIPADQRQMLVRFELLTADEGGHVYQDENDPTRWVMGIGSDLGNEEDYVLIHEFAHLLTLQAGEVPPADDDGTCPTYHTGEGCALSDSTFAGFVARFWPDELLERLDREGPEAVYDDDPSQFVTDYAATNPAEDLAETFTAFVLQERPGGDTVADRKVQFLWDDPEMVDLRDRIRAEL